MTEAIKPPSQASLPPELTRALPYRVLRELEKYFKFTVDEIRLRSGGLCTVRYMERDVPLSCTLTSEETGRIVKSLCDGSLYAFRETINQGYITLSSGIRVGICGRAACENGKVIGVYDVSSLCIRIPRHVSGLGERVCRLIESGNLDGGILIYSSPGVGKTTLLRSVCERISSPPLRIRTAIVDTRGELAFGLRESTLSCDILSGYPKGYGIELALRTLNPQLIVCDEIGADVSEASAIRSALNSGIPLLASSHASSLESLLRRPSIAELHRSACFGYYVGIRRDGGKKDYTYTVTRRNDAARYVD